MSLVLGIGLLNVSIPMLFQHCLLFDIFEGSSVHTEHLGACWTVKPDIHV